MSHLWGKVAAVFLLTVSESVTNISFASSVDQSDNRAAVQQTITSLLSTNKSNLRNKAILYIAGQTSTADIQNGVTILDEYLSHKNDDPYAKMYYGYGLLFMASDFLSNKNYMRAAELSKQGFFYIDEAAESMPDDWRLRFLRARMDSFVPAKNGRCVVALKDINWLEQSSTTVSTLHPLIGLMKARAQESCKTGGTLAGTANPEQAAVAVNKKTPSLTSAEISDVLKPILGA